MIYTKVMDHRYRKFLALADTGRFSAAARQLHVTQPAITIAVASLEHALGVKLYVRRTAPIELTHEGEVVAASARAMAAEFERMRALLQQSTSTGQYQVGLIDSIARLLYAAPGDRSVMNNVEVMVDNSRRILNSLVEGKIDLGVITGQPAALGAEFTVHKLHNEEFVFVAAPQRAPLVAVSRIDDWLATNQDSTSYRHFKHLFAQKGLQVTPICHSASMELLRDMAIAGKGTALLPRHVVQEALDAGLLTLLKIKPLYRPIWAVTRRSDASSSAGPLTTYVNQLLGVTG